MPGRRVRHSWQEKQGAQTLEGWSTGTLGQKRVLELLVASDRNCSKQLKLEKGVGGIQWLKVLQGVGRGGMGWGGWVGGQVQGSAMLSSLGLSPLLTLFSTSTASGPGWRQPISSALTLCQLQVCGHSYSSVPLGLTGSSAHP